MYRKLRFGLGCKRGGFSGGTLEKLPCFCLGTPFCFALEQPVTLFAYNSRHLALCQSEIPDVPQRYTYTVFLVHSPIIQLPPPLHPVILGIVAACVNIYFFWTTKFYITNNLLGMSFCICAIPIMSLSKGLEIVVFSSERKQGLGSKLGGGRVAGKEINVVIRKRNGLRVSRKEYRSWQVRPSPSLWYTRL